MFARLWHLATPLALIQLAQTAIATTDLIILGRYDMAALAGGALGMTLFNFLRTQGFGLLVGSSNLVAGKEGHNEDILQACRQLAVAAAVLAMLLLLLAAWFAEYLAATADVAQVLRAFLFALAPGFLPLFLFYAYRNLLVGQRRAKGLLGITFLVLLLNAALDYALLYGKWGLPAMGVSGVALASTLCLCFQLAAIVFLARKRDRSRGSDVAYLRHRIFALGLPTAGSYAAEAGYTAGLMLIAARISPSALATHAVLDHVLYLAFMFAVGISHATSVLFSEAQVAMRRSVVRCGWLTGLAVCGLCALVYILFPGYLAALFLEPQADLALTAAMFPLLVLVQPFDYLQNITMGALRANGQAGRAFSVVLGGYWLFALPLAALLAWCFGLAGLWLGFALGMAAVAARLMLLLWRAL